MGIHRNLAPISWVKQVTIDLSAAKEDEAIDLGGAYLAAFTVLDLTGAASVKLGDCANALELTEGQARSGFDADGLTISTEGSTGGTITLELHGRY